MNPSEKPTEVPRYDIKDSGERRTFSTGAQRDRAGGKSRPDLISPIALWRLGLWLEKGAQKYTERNWEKGMPLSEYIASAHRHLLLLADGNEDEDHASALLFNAMAFIHTEHRIRSGDLPSELDDLLREKNLRNFLLTSAETPPKVEKPADDNAGAKEKYPNQWGDLDRTLMKDYDPPPKVEKSATNQADAEKEFADQFPNVRGYHG